MLGYLSNLQNAVLAYSGGVDSTLLLYLLKKADLEKVLAVTADSPSYSVTCLEVAKRHTSGLNIEHLIIETAEMDNQNFVSNSPKRCYFCKYELFSTLKKVAQDRGINNVLDASHKSDIYDYRPGLKAGEELSVISPFMKFGWNKGKIKMISKSMDIFDWDRPNTVCFASRVPYGTPVTIKNLAMIEAAEDFLQKLDFHELRVRSDGITARIELLPKEIARLVQEDIRQKITKKFINIGFKFVSLDIEGFKSGKTNRLINSG